MRKTVRIIGVSLVLLAGLLLVSGVAWAQANKTTLSGIATVYRVTDPGKIWLDEDGVRHWRNQRARQRLTVDLDGLMYRIDNLNINTVTREADFHGSFTFTGFLLGEEDHIRATGRFSALCSGEPSMCEEHQIWSLEDGRRIKLTETFPLDVAGDDLYEGTLLDPPGHR
jgi:hypothetical protein